MTKLYIDNSLADLDPSSEVSVSLSVASLTSTSLGRAGYSKSITIPATPHNRQLMGDCEQPLAAQMFNHSTHTARVEVDGCVIIEGVIYLTASSLGQGGFYRFNIIGNAREWVGEAAVSLANLKPEWSAPLDFDTIEESHSDEGYPLVRFLPVERGRGEERNGAHKPKFFNRVVLDMFHPFVHIGTLVEAIFARAGYAVESEFFGSEFFKSLYMSGRWSERPHGDWGEKMAFVASRAEDSEVVEANSFGRVVADPLANFNSVGNIVDHIDSGSEAIGFDHLGRIVFTPTTRLAAAFEFHLRYRTDYRIVDRKRLRGLTLLHPNIGDGVNIGLENPYRDHRGEVMPSGYIFNLAIFELVEGATYNLTAEEIVNPEADPENLAPGDVRKVILKTGVAERFTPFTVATVGPIVNPRLEMVKDGLSFSPASDWAIYSGNVAERGNIGVEVTFQTKAHYCSPSEPHLFDMFYFGGGEEGQKFQLLAGSTMKPLLVPHPEFDDVLRWEDVMNYHEVTGMDLLMALKELFDLQIYTDPLDRKVCIEPRRDYCDPQVVVDLSDRLDIGRGVVVEELGGDHPQMLSVGYRTGDKAAAEHPLEEGEEWGRWSATIDNIFAPKGCRTVTNRLFTAAVDVEGSVSHAPSAHLIRVGDSSDAELHAAIQRRNFLPKIVSYRGLKELPLGEHWDYPLEGASHYPLATFFDDGSVAGEARSLLVGDHLGVEGLHRWWDQRVEALNHSRRVSLYLSLRPEEVEQIVVPNSTKRDFRAHYVVTLDGERVLCRLEEVVDYNPQACSTKVVLTTV